MDQVDVQTLFSLFKPEGVLPAIGIIAIASLATRLGTDFLDALSERFTERRLLFKQITALFKFSVLLLTGAMVTVSVVQFTEELFTFIGAGAAVTIGFAFKDLLASLTAGIILLFDRPFQVGDRVEFDGQYGEVMEIGLRTVRIATLDDNLVSIPNNRFLSDVVSCANAGALHQMCVFKFWIGCEEDYEKARQIIYEATAASRYVYLALPIAVHMKEGPVPEGAERFAIQLTAKAYVFDGRYESAFGTDVHERVKAAFRRYGIRTAGEIEWGPPGGGAHHAHPAPA